VSHVTVSRFWRAKGKGVTCNGFCGLGGRPETVSHVTVAVGLEETEEVSHVTVAGVWREKGNGVAYYGSRGLDGKGKRWHM
jgi:hypothetical protein